jgi:hypothetical protein
LAKNVKSSGYRPPLVYTETSGFVITNINKLFIYFELGKIKDGGNGDIADDHYHLYMVS